MYLNPPTDGWREFLLSQSGPQPQGAKERQRNQQHNYGGRKAHVEIAVGIIYRVVADQIPSQKRENGKCRGRKKRKKTRGKRQQQALEKTESFQRKSEECATRMTLAPRRLHRLQHLSRLEYCLDAK